MTAAVSHYSGETTAPNAFVHPTHYYSLPVEARTAAEVALAPNLVAAVVAIAPIVAVVMVVGVVPTVMVVVVATTVPGEIAAAVAVPTVAAVPAASTRFVEEPVDFEMQRLARREPYDHCVCVARRTMPQGSPGL